jgi:hypothetical protein
MPIHQDIPPMEVFEVDVSDLATSFLPHSGLARVCLRDECDRLSRAIERVRALLEAGAVPPAETVHAMLTDVAHFLDATEEYTR